MVYMENWRMIMFLGTPVMPDLTSLITTGLYINDLSMHDFSRYLREFQIKLFRKLMRIIAEILCWLVPNNR